jgi:hypothetical protein
MFPFLAKLNGKSSDHPSSVENPLRVQSRGSCEALQRIVVHFGDDLERKLAVFVDRTVGAVGKVQHITVQGARLMNLRPGTDVMILKNIFAEKFSENWRSNCGPPVKEDS